MDTEAQTGGEGMKPEGFQWIREPETWKMDGEGRLEVITVPCTDLWQKTYYHFQNVIAVWILSNFIGCRKCLFMGVSRIL